jgi:hypothetical protein
MVPPTEYVLQRQGEIATRLPRIFAESQELLATALADERNDLSNRIRLARIDASLQLLSRQATSFVSLGAMKISRWRCRI